MTCFCLRLCLNIKHKLLIKPTQNIKATPPATNNEFFPSLIEKSLSLKKADRSVGNELGSAERVGETVGD